MSHHDDEEEKLENNEKKKKERYERKSSNPFDRSNSTMSHTKAKIKRQIKERETVVKFKDQIELSPLRQTDKNEKFDAVVPDVQNEILSSNKTSLAHRKSEPICRVRLVNGEKRRNSTEKFSKESKQIIDADFLKIFKSLPSNEELIVGYSCAYRKDIFMQGRLFLSVNYLSFYARLFKREECFSVGFKEISSVTREKSIKLFSNAIRIRTRNGEQHVFACQKPREEIFIAIFRLWQNVLMNQPVDAVKLRSTILAEKNSSELSITESDDSNRSDHRNKSLKTLKSLPETLSRETKNEKDETRLSLKEKNKESQAIYRDRCACGEHFSRVYFDGIVEIKVNELFQLIFDDNETSRSVHKAQKLIDYKVEPWIENKSTNKRERSVSYLRTIKHPLGETTVSCFEKQILEKEENSSIFVINIEGRNDGIKLSESYYAAIRYCMTQRDARQTWLQISAEIKFVRGTFPLTKAVIDKFAYPQLEEAVRIQVEQILSRPKSPIVDENPVKVKREHLVRQKAIVEQSSVENVRPSTKTFRSLTSLGFLYDFALILTVLLLLVHIFISYKLYIIDKFLARVIEEINSNIDEHEHFATS